MGGKYVHNIWRILPPIKEQIDAERFERQNDMKVSTNYWKIN